MRQRFIVFRSNMRDVFRQYLNKRITLDDFRKTSIYSTSEEIDIDINVGEEWSGWQLWRLAFGKIPTQGSALVQSHDWIRIFTFCSYGIWWKVK